MTYEGYLRIGGVEVVNTERARGYTTTTDCPTRWIVSDPCETLADAMGDIPYLYSTIDDAPWYDRSLPDLSSRFFGVVGISIAGMTDSTRSASQTEGVTNGGVVGRTRKGMRNVRVRATLIGRGRDALDYGIEWMSAVFDGGCSQHGSACDVTDMEVLVDCPPPRGTVSDGAGGIRPRTDAEYAALVDPLRRYLHDITVTSGPITVSEFKSASGEFYGAGVEFTVTSERAWVYGKMKQLTLAPSLPSVVQDIPYNLIPYPSAELGGGLTVPVLVNAATNPGLEVDATGWAGSATAVSGADPTSFFTQGRSTDIGAGGSAASFRSRILGNNGSTVASGVADLKAATDVTLTAGTNRRISLNQWAAALVLNGTAPTTRVNSLTVSYRFFNGVTPLGAAVIFGTAGAADFSGKAYSLSGLAVPATATRIYIETTANVNWASSATAGQNSDLRLYADALAVSVP